MAKILHIADVHLDSPFSLLDPQKSQARRNELRGTFTSAMMYAKMEKYDIVIIAGDLFDCEFVTRETMDLITSQFAANPDCKFVIAPGNHDFYSSASPYSKTKFPENVYIFTSETLTCFRFDDIGVDVYGYAFTGEKMEKNPLAAAVYVDRERINILAAHADIYSKAYCPVGVEDIVRGAYDYAALGHIHNGGDIQKSGNTYYAYSGSLEGGSFGECGLKGAIICDATWVGGKKQLKFKARRFCTRRYEKLDVDISGAVSDKEVIAKVRRAATENGYGNDTLLRVRLLGNIPVSADIRADKITAEDIGVYYLEVRDCSAPLLDYEELKNDISIRGAFFRELLPQLESEDDAVRARASKALHYGLAALSGDDIVDF